MSRTARQMLILAAAVACVAPAAAKDIRRFAVNEYFGMTYDREPVSFDVSFDEPVPAARIGLRPGPCQVEIVEGTARAVKKARVWTLVSFRPNSFQVGEKDVLDWPALVAKMNGELGSDKPSVSRLAWESIRRELRLGRDAKALPSARPGPDERQALLRGINNCLGRFQKETPAVLASLGLDKKLADDVAKLKERRPPAHVVQKLHRAAMEASWPGLIARHRIWPRHLILTVHTDGRSGSGAAAGPAVEHVEKIAGVQIAEFSNDGFAARVPVGSVTFDPPASPFDVPGPVVSVSRDGRQWIGAGYLDCMPRVRAVSCEVTRGPVYAESRIHYAFEDGRSYRARARLYAAKPYVQLVEDFDLGGAARFVFNYGDWFADGFFRTGDNKLYGWQSITSPNPCADFVRIDGQEALARMVVWTQFNYFGGKQETLALKAPDAKALEAAYEAAVARHQRDLADYREQVADYQRQWDQYEQARRKYADERAKYRQLLAAHKRDPRKVQKPKEPRQPREPRKRTFRKPREPAKQAYEEIIHTLGGASVRATSVVTPGGDATAVGAFYVRPDRWTRAKVNHVDLYMRPEVPGDRKTRGAVGLTGAKLRIAMEAWLVDGHREWAIFAVRAGDRRWLAKAHVTEGVWPLDRIRRLTLAWNSDGSPVEPADTRPETFRYAGGAASTVLMGTRGRSGLQYFNGSNGHIRWRPPTEGFDGQVTETKAAGGDVVGMAAQAMTWYTAGDDSAYPAIRAMLPWTHPEALNPFYQGMENMNFSADLYRYMAGHAVRLLKMGHPEGQRFLDESVKRFDMALDRYVYPQSGCWEESHGYAGHTIGITGPLALLLANSGKRDFREDVRFARMMEFFLYVHTPIDPEFGNRVVPAVGDHGQSRAGPSQRFRDIIQVFAGSKHPEIREIVARAAWMIREDGGAPPAGIKPEKPDLRSRWLQGYGDVMRAFGERKHVLSLLLAGALIREGKGSDRKPCDLILTIPFVGKCLGEAARGLAPTYNTARHTGTVALREGPPDTHVELTIDLTVAGDRWVKGGPARYTVAFDRDPSGRYKGTFSGTFRDRQVRGRMTGRLDERRAESFLVLRAGQSWGHHHEDKGSMWFWGRNVHFFGDCSWGGPPGGTYWNRYKQGPAGGTQIEFVGVTNWTLPCKYAAPFISDDEYADQYDYANARCLYPFNPKLDLRRSTPVALRNAYDRQVLFVHPDLLIVRDNVETTCPTIWRMHSFQPAGTRVQGPTATLASPQGVLGELAVLYPARGVTFRLIDRDILNRKYFDEDGQALPHEKLPRFKGSVELRWDMPPNTPATWIFGVHGADEAAPAPEVLDEHGKVTRVGLADGTVVTALMNIEPFAYRDARIEFQGTVGLVLQREGRTRTYPIRAKTLKAK